MNIKNNCVSICHADEIFFALTWIKEPCFKLSSLTLARDSIAFEQLAPFEAACDESGKLSARVVSYIKGEIEILPLDRLELNKLGQFERNILLCLYRHVPCGKVIAYGRLAELAGYPRAARAVGTAMRNNPFPLFFPCHRVAKSDMSPGNYQSGAGIKRLLLKKEGIALDKKGRIPASFFV